MAAQTNIFRPLRVGKEMFHPQSYDENSFVMNYTLEKGGMVPPHLHVHMDEYFSVLRGEMKFIVNGETIIKKAGEAIMVPKGVKHAIKNAGHEQVEMNVTYVPCADTHRMFEAFAAFDEKDPGKMMNMIKAVYICMALNVKEFSAPQPAFIGSVLKGLVLVMGKFGGWKKYVSQFK